MLILVGDEQRRHLAVALAAHCRRLRNEGVRVPAWLAALSAELATGGQRRPPLDAGPAGADAAGMDRLALDYREAGDALGVSDRTVRRAVRAGDLPAVDVAGARRIRTADLAAYVERLQPTNITEEQEQG